MGTFHADLKLRAREILEERGVVKRLSRRSPTMPCLLCKNNLADQTNSHIIPKFLSKGLFGKDGEAYGISSYDMSSRPTIAQSTPKESHILCDECEHYFGVLETLVANGIYKDIWSNGKGAKVTVTKIDDNLDLVVFDSENPKLFTLFVYSIFWRVFVTAHSHFRFNRASVKTIEGLRASLIAYKGNSATAVNQNISANHTPLLQSSYTVVTSQDPGDETSNVVVCLPIANPYILFMNRFVLTVSFKENERQNALKQSNNVVPSNGKLGIAKFSMKAWGSLRSKLVHGFADSANKNLRSKGRRAFDIAAFMANR